MELCTYNFKTFTPTSNTSEQTKSISKLPQISKISVNQCRSIEQLSPHNNIDESLPVRWHAVRIDERINCTVSIPHPFQNIEQLKRSQLWFYSSDQEHRVVRNVGN